MVYRCAVEVIYETDMTEAAQSALLNRAQAVAQAYHWMLYVSSDASSPVRIPQDVDVVLMLDAQGWSARWLAEPKWKPLRFDYAHAGFRRRLAKVGPRAETLIKALGRRRPKRILDCTGGAGEESMLMSAYGAQVHMLERDPVLATLIDDALARASESSDPALAQIAGRITFDCMDAVALLERQAADANYDVIYCDPMFPIREKSALVTKTMQFFHCLLGPPQDAAALVRSALGVAEHRVVVKRPAKAPAVLEYPVPDQQVQNKSVRFDIYLSKRD